MIQGKEENGRRNYFMINLHESMGPGRDRTREPWICSQTRICCQTHYRLRYAARCRAHVSDSQFSGYGWFQILIILKMYALSVYKHAVVAAFCIYAQSGEDAAKRGGWRQCIK